MDINTVRLLTDSAAQCYRRLSAVHPVEGVGVASFDEWLGAGIGQLDHAEAQALRRDYRRLVTIIDEIETLVRSRPQALNLVRERAAVADADAQRLADHGSPTRPPGG
jgi:hypothetical protein